MRTTRLPARKDVCRADAVRPMTTVMRAIKLHADEIETDVALVRRLLAGQFPQWADLPVVPVASHGADHDIYRLR